MVGEENMTTPVAKISWTKTGQVKIKLRKLQPVEVSKEEFFTKEIIPKEMIINVKYSSGPSLVGRANDIYRSGFCSGLIVSGENGHHTTVGPLTDITIRIWSDDDIGIIAQHPVAKIIEYAPQCNPESLKWVIARIFDPRWYKHPERPDRLSLLEALFRLEPMFDKHSKGEAYAIRNTLRECWWIGPRTPIVSNDYFGKLYETLIKAGVPESVAVRKVGRRFLRAINSMWLDGYTAGRPGEKMFEPKMILPPLTV